MTIIIDNYELGLSEKYNILYLQQFRKCWENQDVRFNWKADILFTGSQSKVELESALCGDANPRRLQRQSCCG